MKIVCAQGRNSMPCTAWHDPIEWHARSSAPILEILHGAKYSASARSNFDASPRLYCGSTRASSTDQHRMPSQCRHYLACLLYRLTDVSLDYPVIILGVSASQIMRATRWPPCACARILGAAGSCTSLVISHCV